MINSLLIGVLFVLVVALIFNYLNIIPIQTFTNNLPLAIPFVAVWVIPGLILLKNQLNIEKNKNKIHNENRITKIEQSEFKENKFFYSNTIYPHLYIKKLISQSQKDMLIRTFKIGIPLVIGIFFIILFFSAFLVSGFNLKMSFSLLKETTIIILIPAILLSPILIPILILVNYITPHEFKNMIESLSLGDFNGLKNDIEA